MFVHWSVISILIFQACMQKNVFNRLPLLRVVYCNKTKCSCNKGNCTCILIACNLDVLNDIHTDSSWHFVEWRNAIGSWYHASQLDWVLISQSPDIRRKCRYFICINWPSRQIAVLHFRVFPNYLYSVKYSNFFVVLFIIQNEQINFYVVFSVTDAYNTSQRDRGISNLFDYVYTDYCFVFTMLWRRLLTLYQPIIFEVF